MVVLKYPLPVIPTRYPLFVNQGTVPLSIQVQNNNPVLYCAVEAESHAHATMVVQALWTGEPQELEDGMKYLGTAMLSNGTLVMHYYVKIMEEE